MSKAIFSDEGDEVELITLHTERLLQGGSPTDERVFQSLDDALRFAESMRSDQQAASWIRAGGQKLTIPEARSRLAEGFVKAEPITQDRKAGGQ